jgi:phage terminase large subunit GpA-like protein
MNMMETISKAPSNRAYAIVAKALAKGIAPIQQQSVSSWCAANLVVGDGPRAGQLWDPSFTPQLVEVLDQLQPGQGHNQVVLRKSAQVGATGIGISWMAYMACQMPCAAMVIMPTVTTAQEFNRSKLQPSIDATPALRSRMWQTKSRSARASTALSKNYPGGSMTLTGANSAADLRSKTVKIQHRDEIDEYPVDLEGQGDPEVMMDARLISYHASGDYMVFKSSTPTIKGSSRIDRDFEKGDQRFWHMPCPHCGEYQKLVFGSDTTKNGLKFAKEPPYQAHYVCVNGCVIDHSAKNAMIDQGRWVAENAAAGLSPSYHIDSLSSKLTTWDHIAAAFMAAKKDAQGMKGFLNLWLGHSWEERGDAPEWKRLMVAREAYKRRTIPIGGLIHTMAADVQGDGIYYEVVSWGRDGQSWSIDYGFLPGETGDPQSAAWVALTEIYERRYPDAYGNHWPVDLAGVDSGYNTDAVLKWVRGKPNAKALKGEDGWYRPALGMPAGREVSGSGKKRKRGVLIWPVGTWPLKGQLYAMLRKEGPRDGHELTPPGYCHFGEFHDELYFKQLTAEILKDTEKAGRIVKKWVETGPNHLHDCRIYNMALIDHWGIRVLTAEEWALITAQRARAKPGVQTDMIDMLAAPPPVPVPANKTAAPQQGKAWIEPQSGWIR